MSKEIRKLEQIFSDAIYNGKEVIAEAYQIAISGDDIYLACDIDAGQLFIDYSDSQEQFYENVKNAVILYELNYDDIVI